MAETPTENFEYDDVKVIYSCRNKRYDNLEHFIERGDTFKLLFREICWKFD